MHDSLELYFHALVTSDMDMSVVNFTPKEWVPGRHRVGGCLGGLNAEKRKIGFYCRESSSSSFLSSPFLVTTRSDQHSS